ncbi:type IV pilin [Natronorubrum sulfidifaciens]|uniref:Flagellin domain-containing protein n=1 Tax=Natronorubrum sulfidifaciens JCM 14089 TaxID=1230460 RepID=L9W7A7_9EURY|nr:type IV pilin [Natronorubrum sulfidifaciens]ELY45136.1 flagellin domain-containing protein [Natronorubrum sulfidifaciens JCM 14089]
MTDRPDANHPTATLGASRGLSPLVGLVALLALTVALAAVVAVGVGALSLEAGAPTTAFDLAVDGETSTITIEHVGGEPIDVTALSMTVAVDDEDLTNQPPVPFVGATGFDGTPTGPFNAATDSEWRAGERATVVVADTNDPHIETGDVVTVTLTVDDARIAVLEATAR